MTSEQLGATSQPPLAFINKSWDYLELWRPDDNLLRYNEA
jgi:hypothetical protein